MSTVIETAPLAEFVNGVRIVRGRRLACDAPEFQEMNKYESGQVDRFAEALEGPHHEPILNLMERYNPAERQATQVLFTRPDLRSYLKGRTIDLGAGACYFSAELSKLAEVSEVAALDMSERFLATTGLRVFDHLGGERSKLTLTVATFEEVPFPDGYFDTACFLASIHHSLAPIKALMEARRVVRPGGRLLLLELIPSDVAIEKVREHVLELTRKEGVTETTFTRSELTYRMRHAGWTDIAYHPLDFMTGNVVKRWARRCLRIAGLESTVLTTLYWIVATNPVVTTSSPE